MLRENAFKKRLIAGERGNGCWLHLDSPIAAEILALAGFESFIIDHEHGPGELTGAVRLMQAISATPASPIMRVPWNDPVMLKRALDIGVEGVMIPSVSSADEARAAVAACRYPPRGTRGAAYGLTRAADYGLSSQEYVETAHENLLIICQIETRQAVAAAAEIAAVDGVDMLFIGPFDLSGDMGRLAQFDDPEFLTLRGEAEAATRASGKLLGGIPVAADMPPDLAKRGYDFIVSGSDVLLLRDAAVAQLAALAGDTDAPAAFPTPM